MKSEIIDVIKSAEVEVVKEVHDLLVLLGAISKAPSPVEEKKPSDGSVK